jgi:hypothetical protein
LSAVEQNLRASLDYAQRLVRAKDLQEIRQIQSEFARTQTEAMQAQMKEYGSVMQSAMDTAKGIAQSAAETMKDATQTGTCFPTHHLVFASDAHNTLWTSAGGPGSGVVG